MVRQMVFALLAGHGLAASAQVDGTAKPTFKIGEVAVYAVNQRGDKKVFDEVSTVTAVTASETRFSHVRPDREPASVDTVFTPDMHLIQSGASGSQFNPPIQLLKFPLAVGGAWRTSYESLSPNGARSKSELDVKVVAMEKVTTPAGTFDAFKIESGGWITGISWNGTVRMAQTQWYAPSIGRWVRAEYKDYRGGSLWTDTVTELKSFKPAP